MTTNTSLSTTEKENKIIIGKKYLLHKKIGEGSFGSLHRGYDIEKNKTDETRHYPYAVRWYAF